MTFLELLVVLAIVGSLWAVAYPTLRGVQDRGPIVAERATPDPLPGESLTNRPLGGDPSLQPLPDESLTNRLGAERCYLVRVGAEGSATVPVPCPDDRDDPGDGTAAEPGASIAG